MTDKPGNLLDRNIAVRQQRYDTQPRDCAPAFQRVRLLDVAGRWVWQAPPGWPRPPDGWVPGPSWEPDPSWLPAPPDWQWWRFVKIEKPLWYRRAQIAGVAAVVLFFIGMLASFPFVYGDPAPGTTKENPGWFQPVGDACIALLIVGLVLLLVPDIHMRYMRHKHRPIA